MNESAETYSVDSEKVVLSILVQALLMRGDFPLNARDVWYFQGVLKSSLMNDPDNEKLQRVLDGLNSSSVKNFAQLYRLMA